MNRKRYFVFSAVLALYMLMLGCGNAHTVEGASGETALSSKITSSETMMASRSNSQTISEQAVENTVSEEEITTMKMNVQAGGISFTAALEENEAVDALVDMIEQGPVTIHMSDYSGFEKVGPLGMSLPESNQQITAQAGDIVLYQGNQIVMFYGSNSWSYTRIGRIDDLTGWEEALGSGDVIVSLSLED